MMKHCFCDQAKVCVNVGLSFEIDFSPGVVEQIMFDISTGAGLIYTIFKIINFFSSKGPFQQ